MGSISGIVLDDSDDHVDHIFRRVSPAAVPILDSTERDPEPLGKLGLGDVVLGADVFDGFHVFLLSGGGRGDPPSGGSGQCALDESDSCLYGFEGVEFLPAFALSDIYMVASTGALHAVDVEAVDGFDCFINAVHVITSKYILTFLKYVVSCRRWSPPQGGGFDDPDHQQGRS